ncbi:MAG: hypothetical protein M1376_14305 [Planctomycetes bacterium]|nr:hypothetical protein [Planctomycetota bacterium]
MRTGLCRRWSLAVLLCAALSPLALNAATLRVGDGATDLKTIQAAVDAAAVGDTIIVSPGTYSGSGNWDINLQGKVLTIQGANPLDPNTVERTVIDCAGTPQQPHRAFYVVDCNSIVISGLTITHGLASAGGAVYCHRSTLDVMYCRILDNATLPGGDEDANGGPGGGLYCEDAVVQIVGCLVRGNTAGGGAPSKEGKGGAGGNGGGISSVNSDISVISSTVSGNTAGAGGDSSKGTAGNGGDGGGICGDTVRMADSTVSLNAAGAGGQGALCGRGGRGGGLYADTATLDRCILEANRAGDEGQPSADATEVRGSGAGDGGGLCSNLLDISSGLITGNRAGRGYVADPAGWVDHGNGGGIWCASGAVRQCTIVGNAVYQPASRPDVNDPSTGGKGSGLFCTANVVVANSILYANAPDQIAGQDCNNVVYCDIQPAQCPSGGNKAEDPMFVRNGGWVDARDPNVAVGPDDPNAVWVQGDYHLKVTSPLIDAGDPNYVPEESELDLDGHPRRMDAAIDMGAYESSALVPVYRFWSPVTGKHFYTISEAEKDKLINQYASVWTFEGPAYYAYLRASDPNLLPVYRFWSQKLSSHFYTMNEAEKDKLIRQYPDIWAFEGAKFYAYPEGKQPAGTRAVYRFWSETLGGHFYTIREAEKDKLINQYADTWAFEGVAWYAYATLGPEPVDPNAAVYEFRGGVLETACKLTLKAFIDGKEAKIDKPEVTYTPDSSLLTMTVNLPGLTTTLNEFLVETAFLQQEVKIGGDGDGTAEIPIVLSSNVLFAGRMARGPFGIDPNTLTFPTTASGALPGNNESFTIGGSVTVDGSKLDVGLVARATQFATGGPGVFDTSLLPDVLAAHLDGTFQWSCRDQQNLLLETTVKGSVLQIYVSSAEIQTTGVWQGREKR